MYNAAHGIRKKFIPGVILDAGPLLGLSILGMASWFKIKRIE
jgi:hypothetical protein